MQVRVLSVTGVVALAAVGLVVVPGTPALAVGCTGTAGFDVNLDGVDDTAIGVPKENVGTGAKDAGSVTIVYGASGTHTFGSDSSLLLTQESLGGKSEANDQFGAALAIGDVNNDGCKDLVIGVPGENSGAGRIQIVFGSAAGTFGSLRQSISQDSGSVPGTAEDTDEFGAAVAVQGSGSSARLWVGAPGENLGSDQGAGMVTRFSAGPAGKSVSTSSGMASYSQDTTGVPGDAEDGDRFGAVLSGSEHSLLIGVPREDIGTLVDAGAVYAFTNTWTSFHQDTTTPVDVPGTGETGDRFGAAVAQLTSCGPNPSDEAYVVGVPSENLGTASDAGAVTVVDLPAGTALSLAQGTAALPDTSAEDGDLFGLRVAAAGSLLVASAPEEDLATTKNAGSAYQAQMGCNAGVPAVVTSANLTLDTEDVVGSSSSGDRFGLELAFSWTNEGDVQGPSLLVGVPLGADGSVLDSGRVSSLGTTAGGLFVGAGSTYFGQSTTGIAGGPETNDQFGVVIASNGR